MSPDCGWVDTLPLRTADLSFRTTCDESTAFDDPAAKNALMVSMHRLERQAGGAA